MEFVHDYTVMHSSQHSVLAFQHCIFMPIHVHGLLGWSDRASSRVLYAGRGHGDVTVDALSRKLHEMHVASPSNCQSDLR